MKTTLLILTTFALLYYGIVWDTGRITVQPGCAGVCREEIKAAIKHMGPNKNYDLYFPSGILKVEVNGEYLRLQY